MTKKSIALVGAESTGKTTLAMMLAARLRTRGVLADVAYEPGKSLPFPPALLDTEPMAWVHRIATKLAHETEMRLRPNIDFLVCDRTPLDFVTYMDIKLKRSAMSDYWYGIAGDWLAEKYDTVYFLPIAGSSYIEDGFRAPAEQNSWRTEFEDTMLMQVTQIVDADKLVVVEGATYRTRAEFVYHHVLAAHFGETRPLRAYKQVEQWLKERGWRVLEVRPQGSNSITRFHAPSDKDDIDAMVIVDGDILYAEQVRSDFLTHKEHLENIVQADLDLLITPKGMEAHEI